MLAVAEPLARPKSEYFNRPLRDGRVFLLHFPALRTGLLSNVPCGTIPLRIPRDLRLTHMGSRRPIFNPTLRAADGWLFFRVARSLRTPRRMLVALKNGQLVRRLPDDVTIICETVH
jgi:hypothetical protein